MAGRELLVGTAALQYASDMEPYNISCYCNDTILIALCGNLREFFTRAL